MKSRYEIYHHPTKGYAAVAVGFSIWPWLFTWIWAFTNRLWLVGCAFIAVDVVGTFLARTGMIPLLGLWPLWLAIKTYAGFEAANWKAASLANRGYRFCGVIEAVTASAATALAQKNAMEKATLQSAPTQPS